MLRLTVIRVWNSSRLLDSHLPKSQVLFVGRRFVSTASTSTARPCHNPTNLPVLGLTPRCLQGQLHSARLRNHIASSLRFYSTQPSLKEPFPPITEVRFPLWLKRLYGQGTESDEADSLVQTPESPDEPELHESPYTVPNALTLTRILACPWLGYEIIMGNYPWATGILFACGVSDWVRPLRPTFYKSRTGR